MPSSPVPAPVAEELGRLGVRWQQLALPEAVSRLPAVRAVIEALAGEPVPDLGPAVVMDQLTVVVFDACARQAGGRAGGPPEAPADGPAGDQGAGSPAGDVNVPDGVRYAVTDGVLAVLVALRRSL